MSFFFCYLFIRNSICYFRKFSNYFINYQLLRKNILNSRGEILTYPEMPSLFSLFVSVCPKFGDLVNPKRLRGTVVSIYE